MLEFMMWFLYKGRKGDTIFLGQNLKYCVIPHISVQQEELINLRVYNSINVLKLLSMIGITIFVMSEVPVVVCCIKSCDYHCFGVGDFKTENVMNYYGRKITTEHMYIDRLSMFYEIKMCFSEFA